MTAYMPIVAETNLTIQVHIVMQCLIWTFSAEKNATKQQIQNERCKYHQRQLTRQNNLCCIAGHAIWKRLNWINSMIVSAFFFCFVVYQFNSNPQHTWVSCPLFIYSLQFRTNRVLSSFRINSWMYIQFLSMAIKKKKNKSKKKQTKQTNNFFFSPNSMPKLDLKTLNSSTKIQQQRTNE